MKIEKVENLILTSTEAEFLAIKKTLDILHAISAESENEDTLTFVYDAKAPLIELLNNVFKRK